MGDAVLVGGDGGRRGLSELAGERGQVQASGLILVVVLWGRGQRETIQGRKWQGGG